VYYTVKRLARVCVCVCQSPDVDVWQTLAELFNKLPDVDISSNDIRSQCPAEAGNIIIALCSSI